MYIITTPSAIREITLSEKILGKAQVGNLFAMNVHALDKVVNMYVWPLLRKYHFPVRAY